MTAPLSAELPQAVTAYTPKAKAGRSHDLIDRSVL
jgi:hypothetical protein